LMAVLRGSIKISSLSDEGKEIWHNQCRGNLRRDSGPRRRRAQRGCDGDDRLRTLGAEPQGFFTSPRSPGGSLHDPAENPVPAAAAASGIGTFANFSPCAGLWRQKSVSQWTLRWRKGDSNPRSPQEERFCEQTSSSPPGREIVSIRAGAWNWRAVRPSLGGSTAAMPCRERNRR